MSTKTKQTQANTYDPQSMRAFHNLQPMIGSPLSRFLGSGSPMTSQYYKQAYGAGMQNAGNLGAGAPGNIMQNMAASGPIHPGVMASLLGSSGMQNSFLGQ